MSIVGVIVLAFVWTLHVVSGQGSQGARSQSAATIAGKAAASFAGLTAADYIEIRQLAARYAYAVDTGADNGNVYASLFAPDGAFADRMNRETKGREALAALARRNTRGPQSAFHFIVNHVIEPTSDGAVGKEYLLQLRIGDGDRPEGWRFKARTFIASATGTETK